MNPVWHFVNGVPVVPVLQITQQALAGDGLVTAPSWSFLAEPTTGWYRSGTGQISTGQTNAVLVKNGTTPKIILDPNLITVAGVELASDYGLYWSSTTSASGAADASITRGGAGQINTDSAIARTGANGQALIAFQTLTELVTVAAAATTDTTIQMPAGAHIWAVSARTTVVIPTATSYSVGDSGLATRFNTANVGVAANSTDPGTKAGVYYNASALSVRLTMNGGTPAANTGRVRITIYYTTVTPPTS